MGARAAGPVFAFTNTNPTHWAYLTPRFGNVLAEFERIFLSSSIGMRKPEARAFQHVAAEMGCAPEEILFFDDSPANVEGARAVGLQTVLVRSTDDVVAAIDTATG